ncbi:MAG: TetR/AcrR family transcriptional regulator [Gammaproteobacteria bacterium]|nr:TetR/AcrR family transcriptional regulator [Gammaproteobacteria bacterium]MDH5594592.1 TetR/AcrR family transcriptional regulator [Gammaproteobacteria bacterium]MDH5614634.1 TetR/AcrR family transcriptional regulator [Gammaproteobacteria bacterium]
MVDTKENIREKIITVADDLFYRNGYVQTSFSTISEAVGISRGNFYYHFKTKDEILDAVINRRMGNVQRMLDQWETEGKKPEDRIRCFINILLMNKVKIKQFGCPIGTLSTELVKLEHESQEEANKLFTLIRGWLRDQFIALGKKKEADELAMHLLARSQGIATLANAFHDEKFIKNEVKQMNEWLESTIKKQ